MNEEIGKEAIIKCETIEEARLLLNNCKRDYEFMSLHANDGSYQEVSDSFKVITRYGLDDVVGESAYSYSHPDDVKEVLKSHATVTLKPDVFSVSIRYRKSSGGYVKLQSYSMQLQGDENEEMIIVLSIVAE